MQETGHASKRRIDQPYPVKVGCASLGEIRWVLITMEYLPNWESVDYDGESTVVQKCRFGGLNRKFWAGCDGATYGR